MLPSLNRDATTLSYNLELVPNILAASSAVLALIFTWSLAAAVLTGIGLAFRRLFQIRSLDLDDLFCCFLLGFSFVLWFSEAYNLLLPIDWRATSILVLLGAIGIALYWRSLAQWCPSALTRCSPLFGLFLFILCVWTANHAAGYAAFYDDGNYRVTVVRWATEYPTVRGLGNLDGHFAFNNASLLYQAMLEIPGWKGQSVHLGNSLVIVTVLAFFLIKARRAILERSRLSPGGIASVILLSPLAVLVVGGGVSSSVTDYPSDVLFFASAWMLVEHIRTPSRDWQRHAFHVVVLAMVFTSLPCIKMSSALFSIAAWPLLMACWLARSEIPWEYRRMIALWSAALSLVCSATWVYRTALLSGYPFFPALQFGFSVPWRIPKIYAEWSAWYIRTWARAPYSDHLGNGYSWIPIWVRNEWRVEKVDGWLLPMILGGLSAYIFIRRKSEAGGSVWSPKSAILWVPPLIAIPAWALNAPLFRFASGLLWYSAALLAAVAIRQLYLQSPTAAAKAVIVASLIPFVSLGLDLRLYGAKLLFVVPGKDRGFHPLPVSSLMTRTSRYGVSIFVPNPDKCSLDVLECVVWNHPLPAAQNPKDTLAFLTPGRMQAGFQLLEPSTPWPIENSAAVAAKARQEHMSERQLANYFRVHPKWIEKAMGIAGQPNNH
jgi:hypothetical protein